MTATKVQATLAQRVAEEFPANVAQHQMTVEQSNGVHRCLLFKQPSTANRYFRVITYPGALCISGDMGTFVFSRLHDMFEFFRKDREGINPQYWSGKLVGIDRNDFKRFDADKFKAKVVECFNSWTEDRDLTHERVTELRLELEHEVLSCAHDGEHEAIRAMMEFEIDRECPFSEFYEYNCDSYTYHFLWCCHAIVWAIQQFDAFELAAPAAPLTESR